MKSWISFLLLLTPFLAGGQSASYPGQGGLDKKRQSRIDSLIQSEISLGNIPGAVLQISQHNRILYSKAYGYAIRFDEKGGYLKNPVPMTTGHLFDIASLTKVTGTTTALMKLVSEGRLNVDDPVSLYLPAFRSPDKSVITTRHLLTHSSGIYEWYPMYFTAKGDRQQTYALIASLHLKYPVGKERHYSDLGFTVLGQLIETISGMPLERYLEDSIFRPLGMLHTFYLPLKRNYKGPIAPTSFGNPYEYRMTHDSSLHMMVPGLDPESWTGWRNYLLNGEVNDGNAWYANGGVSGAAGLFSTVGDLQQLLDMLMHKGRVGKQQFIREAVVSDFLTSDSLNNGLGWMMDPSSTFMKHAPAGSFGHTGFTGTSMVGIPESGYTLILLINRQQKGLLPNKEYYNVSPLRGAVLHALLSK